MTTFFQIHEGVLKLAHKGTKEELKAKVMEDIKESVKQVAEQIKETKAKIKELKKLKDKASMSKALQLELHLETYEKEFVRLEQLTMKDFMFYSCEEVSLEG